MTETKFNDLKLYEVKFGALYSKKLNRVINNLAVVYDSDAGILLKYGDSTIDGSYLKEYATKLDSAINIIGDSRQSIIKYIAFDTFHEDSKEQINQDDICTLLNYGIQCSGGFKRLMDIESLEEFKAEIARLRKIGY